MSHFAYFAPFGVWPILTVVPHDFLQQVDQNLFKAVNGDDGGTWAPTSVITIGGSGLTVSGVLTASGSTFFTGGFMTVSAVATFGGTNFNVEGIAQFDGAVICTSTLSVTGNFACTGNANISLQTSTGSLVVNTTMACTGAATLHGVTCTTLTASGAVQTNGSLTTVGNLNVAGGSTFTAGPQVFSGNARPARPIVSVGATAGMTASPQAASYYYYPSTAAGSTVQISDTGAVDGDSLEFFVVSTTQSLAVLNPSAVLITPLIFTSTNPYYAKVVRVSGTWTLVNYTIKP